MQLHHRVRQAREAAGLSRSALERAAGLTARTVERIELRGQEPARAVLEAIASVLGTSADVLSGASRERPLPEVLDGLVRRHGPEEVAVEAIRAVFRTEV